jgi:hypothetical protein
MIPKDDEVMYRDAHDKLTLWLRKWEGFVEAEDKVEWYKKIFKKYKKYYNLCSLCEKYNTDEFECDGCPLKINGKTCGEENSLYDKIFDENKSALIKMIRIVNKAWKKAKGE